MKTYIAVAVTVCLLGYTLGAVPRGNVELPKPVLEALKDAVRPGFHNQAAKVPYGRVTCYDCTYTEDGESIKGHPYRAGCKDPFDGSNIPNKTCDGQCAKIKSFASVGGQYVQAIVRSCEPICIEDDMEEISEGIKVTSLARCCSGELCNGAVSVSHVSTLIIFWCLGLVTLSYQ